MKKSTLFLTLSVALNAAFAVAFFLRPSPAGFGSNPDPAAARERPAAAQPSTLSAAQLSALQSGNLDRMKTAGLPDDLARTLSAGQVFEKFQRRMREIRKSTEAETRYWRVPFTNTFTKEQRAQQREAQRSMQEGLIGALGDDAIFSERPETIYAFLPPEKIQRLKKIAQDYSDMQSDVSTEANGLQFRADREKIQLLRQEQDRDIAALLTPAELDDYNLRFSTTALTIRVRFGEAIQTEDDYRKIYALQKSYEAAASSFDQTAGPISAAAAAPIAAAQKKMEDDVKSIVGAENFAAFKKANDPDFKLLSSVAKRLSLPPETADTIFASRDSYAAASQRINADLALSAADRRTQLTALATQARADLAKTLGDEAANAYAARSNWISLLKNGGAFSTNPKDASEGPFGGITSTIYTVFPPGSVAPPPPIPARN